MTLAQDRTLDGDRVMFHQARFGGPDAPVSEQGDCWATCIALLLFQTPDMRDELNRAVSEYSEWWNSTVGWVIWHTRGKFTLDHTDSFAQATPYHGLIIASGLSPRATEDRPFEHSVLVDGSGDLAWDPHPSGDGLATARADFQFLRGLT